MASLIQKFFGGPGSIMRQDYLTQVTTLTWVNATTVNVAPGTDTEIDIRRAKSIVVQVDGVEDANHSATDWDINVITTPEAGGTYDTTVWAEETTLGLESIKTFNVPVGGNYMKLRLDENGALRADVTCKVIVKY